MDQLLAQIAEGNQNVEIALQALIKLQMEQGMSQEQALKAMILQAKEQNLQPILEVLVKLQLEQNKVTKEAGAEVAKSVSDLDKKVTPMSRFAEMFFEEVMPKKGEEYYTEEEAAEFLRKATPIKGKDYFTEAEVADFLTRSTPLLGQDYFTAEEVATFKKDVTPVVGVDYFTVDDISDFINRVTPIKGKDYTDGEKGDKGDAFTFADFTKEQLDSFKGKDGSPDTPKDLKKKLESLKGAERLDIAAIKGWEQVVSSLENQLKNYTSQAGLAGGWGGSAKHFLGLTDTPNSYEEQGGKYIRVKSDLSGLEFATVSAGSSSFLDLTDTPSAFTSQSLKGVRVNAGETALEFYVPTDANDALVWGNATGTLSDQADLQAALDAKQATLVSATNIKTINSTSLLGSGDIAVATTAQGASADTAFGWGNHASAGYYVGDGSAFATAAQGASADTAFGWGNHASAGYQAGDALLTSISALAFTGNSLKLLRVNVGETDFEFVAAGGGGATQLDELSDVVSATNTNRFALMANGTTGYVGRALVEADISDLQSYSLSSHNHSGVYEPADGTILKDADIGVTVQAYDADLSTWAGLTPSANAQSLITAANYAAMRTLLDLEAGTDFYSISAANAAFQPLDADLTTIAGLTATTDNFIVSVASAWASRTPAQVRTTLGLVIGTNVQAWDAQLDTWAGVTPSANGQSLVSAADYAAMRGLLDLEAGTDFLSPAAIAAAYQPLDADLTTWAGLTPSANAQSLVTAANYAAMRTLLDLEAGTDFYSIAGADAAFQPKDADLTTLAGLTATTDNFIVSVASAWASRTPAQVRTTLGIGSAGLVATDLANLNESTIEAAIDTLANLTSVQGRTITLADAGADAIFGWDDSASAYQNLSAADVRTALALVVGTNVQAYDADLAALAGLTSAANKIPYFTGSGTAGLLDFKDEDDMTSNSATALPSQQSVKAYVDTAVAGAGGGASEFVRAYVTADQGTSTTSAFKVGFAGETYDPDGNFDNATNYRYTAPSAGKYFIHSQLWFMNGLDKEDTWMWIYKNGAAVTTRFREHTVGDKDYNSITDILDLAQNDYIEIYARTPDRTADGVGAGSDDSYVCIYKLA